MSAPYDARLIANVILDFSQVDRRPQTQLSLYKTLYFAHGLYLVFNDSPLVVQYFEAWKRGPVVKSVRDCFKRFGEGPITGKARKLNLQTGILEPVEGAVTNSDMDFLFSVYRECSGYSGYELSEMTHSKGSPWDRLWNGKAHAASFALRLSNDSIRRYFLSTLDLSPRSS